MRKAIGMTLVAAASCAMSAMTTQAQNASVRLPHDSALAECAAAVSGSDKALAKAITEAAERHYRTALQTRPQDSDLKLMLARTLSQCRTAHAGVFALEGIVNESNELLRAVLAGDSTNWGARFTLALNHYHTPGFFGRQDDAAREFEHLIAQQSGSTLFPELALPFAFLGDLYLRGSRRPEAIAIWRRGAALFPKDSMLIRRLNKHAPNDTLQ